MSWANSRSGQNIVEIDSIKYESTGNKRECDFIDSNNSDAESEMEPSDGRGTLGYSLENFMTDQLIIWVSAMVFGLGGAWTDARYSGESFENDVTASKTFLTNPHPIELWTYSVFVCCMIFVPMGFAIKQRVRWKEENSDEFATVTANDAPVRMHIEVLDKYISKIFEISSMIAMSTVARAVLISSPLQEEITWLSVCIVVATLFSTATVMFLDEFIWENRDDTHLFLTMDEFGSLVSTNLGILLGYLFGFIPVSALGPKTLKSVFHSWMCSFLCFGFVIGLCYCKKEFQLFRSRQQKMSLLFLSASIWSICALIFNTAAIKSLEVYCSYLPIESGFVFLVYAVFITGLSSYLAHSVHKALLRAKSERFRDHVQIQLLEEITSSMSYILAFIIGSAWMQVLLRGSLGGTQRAIFWDSLFSLIVTASAFIVNGFILRKFSPQSTKNFLLFTPERSFSTEPTL